ncbi:MAG: ribonuclease P protein component [Clostridia bacterium]|nr:ribonuclease P protein component [Clostridia bacterium]
MIEKLRLNKEFRRVYGRGKSFVDGAVVTYVLGNRTDKNRVGITVSKKLGSAVLRNRAKRLLTAAFFECLPNLKDGYDIVFVARSKIFRKKSYDVANIMKKHFISAGMWNTNDK